MIKVDIRSIPGRENVPAGHRMQEEVPEDEGTTKSERANDRERRGWVRTGQDRLGERKDSKCCKNSESAFAMIRAS
jgi:hypothetical protein